MSLMNNVCYISKLVASRAANEESQRFELL